MRLLAVIFVLFTGKTVVPAPLPDEFYCYQHEAKQAPKLEICPIEETSRSCSSMVFNGVDVPFFKDRNVSCVTEEDFQYHPVYRGLPHEFCFCGIEGWFGNITYCWCWCEGNGCNTEEKMRTMYSECLDRKLSTEPTTTTIRDKEKAENYEKYFCEIGYSPQPGNATFALVKRQL